MAVRLRRKGRKGERETKYYPVSTPSSRSLSVPPGLLTTGMISIQHLQFYVTSLQKAPGGTAQRHSSTVGAIILKQVVPTAAKPLTRPLDSWLVISICIDMGVLYSYSTVCIIPSPRAMNTILIRVYSTLSLYLPFHISLRVDIAAEQDAHSKQRRQKSRRHAYLGITTFPI